MSRLKEERKKRGTLDVVSKETGINRATLSRYENGTSEPKLETWQKLADYFGVTVGWLQGVSFIRNSEDNFHTDFKDFDNEELSHSEELQAKMKSGIANEGQLIFNFITELANNRSLFENLTQKEIEQLGAMTEQFFSISGRILGRGDATRSTKMFERFEEYKNDLEKILYHEQ